MRRSFRTPSGGMLRTFRRGVRSGETYYNNNSTSSSNHNNNMSLSLSTTTSFSRPLLLSSSATRTSDEFEWVSVNESGIYDDDDDDDEFEFGNVITGGGYVDDNDGVFGLVPSRDEVINAVSSLQLVSLNESGDDNYDDDDEVEFGNVLSSGNYVDDDDVFGLVPSRDEVINAVSALQLVVDPTHYSQFLEHNQYYNSAYAELQENKSPTRFPSRVSSFGSETDWIEPSLNLCYPMMLENHKSIRVYDALHLLQTEPSIQRMVISLSSDKAVWEALLNNEMVRELRDSMSAVQNKEDHDNNGRPERVTNIFSWVFQKTKVKMIEMIEKIVELVNEMFQLSEVEEREESTTAKTEEMLQISLILSIMVLLIVVVNRGHWA